MGCSLAEAPVEKAALGSYYGSMAYADLKEKRQVTRRSDEKYMETTAEPFWRLTMDLSDAATDRKWQRHQV